MPVMPRLFNRDRIVGDRHRALPAKVVAGAHRQRVQTESAPMLHRVHRVQRPRQPSGFRFGDDELQPRMALEHAAAGEMHDRPHSGRHADDRRRQTLHPLFDDARRLRRIANSSTDHAVDRREIRAEEDVAGEDVEVQHDARRFDQRPQRCRSRAGRTAATDTNTATSPCGILSRCSARASATASATSSTGTNAAAT